MSCMVKAKTLGGWNKSLAGLVAGASILSGLAGDAVDYVSKALGCQPSRGNVARAAMVEVRVNDFKDILAITHPDAVAGNVSTAWGNFTSDYINSSTGEPYKVKTGLINDLGAYCGYANSSFSSLLDEMKTAGKYLSSADGNPWGLANGEQPVTAVSVIDINNDGLGIWKYNDANPRGGGDLILDDEDIQVMPQDHVINGVVGDFSNLPAYGGSDLGTWHVTPEPATLGLLGLGALGLATRKRR